MADRPKTMRVKISVDTEDLRNWAEWHADRGHHGVAHVLFKAAEDGEGLTEQALREAREDAKRGIVWRVETACDGYEHLMDEDVPGGMFHDAASYQSGAADAARAIREVLAGRGQP